jgi:hypothetical protein
MSLIPVARICLRAVFTLRDTDDARVKEHRQQMLDA